MSHCPEIEQTLRAELSEAEKSYEGRRTQFDNAIKELTAPGAGSDSALAHAVTERLRTARRYIKALHALEQELSHRNSAVSNHELKASLEHPKASRDVVSSKSRPHAAGESSYLFGQQ